MSDWTTNYCDTTKDSGFVFNTNRELVPDDWTTVPVEATNEVVGLL